LRRSDHCSILEDDLDPVIEEDTVVEVRMVPLSWLRKQLEEADVDLLREMVRVFAEQPMSAEADALCGASHGERSEDR
jgi:hypothetical protein